MIPPTSLSAESARLQILEAEVRYRESTYVNQGGPVLNWYHAWMHADHTGEPDWDVHQISRVSFR